MDYSVLTQLFPNEQKRLDFLIKCALTFGLRENALVQITGIKEDTLQNILFYHEKENVLAYAYKACYRNQEYALSCFNRYLSDLVQAVRNRDSHKTHDLLQILSDHDAIELKNRLSQDDYHLTKEDVLIILRFQLKYGYSLKKLYKLFDNRIYAYVDKLALLGDEYKELLDDYENLNKYYTENQHKVK